MICILDDKEYCTVEPQIFVYPLKRNSTPLTEVSKVTTKEDGAIMSNLSKLQKEAKKAKQFMLAAFNPEIEGYVFVADKDKCDKELTVNVSKAQMYAYGFDDEIMKEKAWSLSTGFDFIAIAV